MSCALSRRLGGGVLKALSQEMDQLIGRGRFTEEITLVGVTALHAEKRELVRGFDALRQDVQLQGPAHADDCSNDGRVGLAQLEIFHEGLIDFECIDRKPL